jgi:hypothetical protein
VTAEAKQVLAHANVFALPSSVLKRIDDLIRGNPKRMSIAMELFEMQHHHSQETLEAWVLKRLEEKFE